MTAVAASPLPWRQHSEMRSATRSELARVRGVCEVMVYDLPAAAGSPRVIGWEIHDGPDYLAQVASRDGFADYDTAKDDATRAALDIIAQRQP